MLEPAKSFTHAHRLLDEMIMMMGFKSAATVSLLDEECKEYLIVIKEELIKGLRTYIGASDWERYLLAPFLLLIRNCRN